MNFDVTSHSLRQTIANKHQNIPEHEAVDDDSSPKMITAQLTQDTPGK